MAVYFVQAGEGGPVKIGYARNVEHRMNYLQLGNHERLSLLRVVSGDQRAECWLHRQFSLLRLEREWFKFAPEMLVIAVPLMPERTGNAHGQIIDLWPSISAFADDIGQKADTVRRWRLRDEIPLKHWNDTAKAAKLRGHTGISTELLLRISRRARAA